MRYHVVFFDTPVCRAWVLAVSVQPFSEDSDANEAGNVSKITFDLFARKIDLLIPSLLL